MTTPARQRSPYALEALTIKLERSALGACWRWRTELLIVLVLAAAFGWLWVVLGSWLWSLAVLGGLALVLAAVPWPRRFLIAWFWALFTRHRLQRAFWELRLHTRAGRLPLIAWITRDSGRLPRPGDLPRGPVLRGLRGQRSRVRLSLRRARSPRHLLGPLVLADLDRRHPPRRARPCPRDPLPAR